MKYYKRVLSWLLLIWVVLTMACVSTGIVLLGFVAGAYLVGLVENSFLQVVLMLLLIPIIGSIVAVSVFTFADRMLNLFYK